MRRACFVAQHARYKYMYMYVLTYMCTVKYKSRKCEWPREKALAFEAAPLSTDGEEEGRDKKRRRTFLVA